MADSSKSNFIDNLPKVYAMYTGGFVAFILLMALLEQAGVSSEVLITAVLPAAIAAINGEKVRLIG